MSMHRRKLIAMMKTICVSREAIRRQSFINTIIYIHITILEISYVYKFVYIKSL